jgi:hypothetical protein
LFIQWHLLDESDEESENRQTIVVANEKDFLTINGLMQKADMQERVLGRVNNNNTQADNTLGGIFQLPDLLKRYPVKEVIFCDDGLSFATIISIIQELPEGTRNKFHASGSSSIIGSDSKHLEGNYVTGTKKYKIGLPLNRRNKNLFDLILAVFFILSFPLHLLLQKKPVHFFKNVFNVLFRKKTWVGYAAEPGNLPVIKKGILSSTSLPTALNELPKESLGKADEWYAQGYTVGADLQKLWRGYKYLYY